MLSQQRGFPRLGYVHEIFGLQRGAPTSRAFHDVRRLRTFRAGRYLKRHLLAFLERLEPLALDR